MSKSASTRLLTLLPTAAFLLPPSFVPGEQRQAAEAKANAFRPAPMPPAEPLRPAAPSAFPSKAWAGRPAGQREHPAWGLSLRGVRSFAYAGHPVTAALRHDGDTPPEGVVVSMTLPAGPAAIAPRGGLLDPTSGRRAPVLPREWTEYCRALSGVGSPLPDARASLTGL